MNFITEENRIICMEEQRQVGEICFPETENGVYDINHTFVDSSMQGKGIAGQLVALAIEEIKRKGGKITASCSYAKRYMEKNNIN
jgi:predicted GNAT family acetyltransferase